MRHQLFERVQRRPTVKVATLLGQPSFFATVRGATPFVSFSFAKTTMLAFSISAQGRLTTFMRGAPFDNKGELRTVALLHSTRRELTFQSLGLWRPWIGAPGLFQPENLT